MGERKRRQFSSESKLEGVRRIGEGVKPLSERRRTSPGVAVKYACIRAHRREFGVALMLRMLGVCRSGCYAARVSGRSRGSDYD
jgi:hypothetical protein